MRRVVFTVTFLFPVLCQSVQAQERVPLPPPDPLSGAVPGLSPTAPQIPNLPPSPSPGPTQGLQPGPLPYSTQPPPLPYSTQPPPFGPYGPPPYGPPPYGPYGPPPYGPPPYGPPPGAFGPMFHFDRAADPAFWVGAEALIWWSRNEPLPVPVATTGPASQGMNAGGLGVPGTVSLNAPLNSGAQGGVRLYAGGWFDQAHTWGLEGSFFIIGNNPTGFSAFDRSGSGNFIINEPLNGSPPFSTFVSYPGIVTGGINVTTFSQFLGTDLNGMYNLYRDANWNITLLAGFRYLELDESLSIVANSTLLTPTMYSDNFGNTLVAPAGSGVSVVDQFNTHNEFYGGQVGARVQYLWNRWSFDGTGLLAIGGTHESVYVNGFTTVFPTNAQPVSYSGGNYATLQQGRYDVNRFAVAPEMRFNVGYQFTPGIRATIGYDAIFLSSVLRPGNQIDNTYDGVTHPFVPLKSSVFWAQGLNLNVRFSF